VYISIDPNHWEKWHIHRISFLLVKITTRIQEEKIPAAHVKGAQLFRRKRPEQMASLVKSSIKGTTILNKTVGTFCADNQYTQEKSPRIYAHFFFYKHIMNFTQNTIYTSYNSYVYNVTEKINSFLNNIVQPYFEIRFMSKKIKTIINSKKQYIYVYLSSFFIKL